MKKNLNGVSEAFWLTFSFALMGAFVALLSPLFTRIFLDEILSGKNADWVKWFFIGMGALAVFQFFVVLLQSRYTKRVAGALALKSNKDYLRHLLRLPMSYFAMRHVGDLQQRMHLNQEITNSLIEVLAPQVINIGLLVLYLFLMFSYSFWLTIIGFVAAGVNLAIVHYFANLRINLIRSMEQSEGQYFSATISCIDNMESIKAAGAETGFFKYWSGLWAHKFNVNANADKQQAQMALLPVMANTRVRCLPHSSGRSDCGYAHGLPRLHGVVPGTCERAGKRLSENCGDAKSDGACGRCDEISRRPSGFGKGDPSRETWRPFGNEACHLRLLTYTASAH